MIESMRDIWGIVIKMTTSQIFLQVCLPVMVVLVFTYAAGFLAGYLQGKKYAD